MNKKISTHNDCELSEFGKKDLERFGFFDEIVPFKYFCSGYWFEKYGLKAKKLINEFEDCCNINKNKNIGIEDLVERYGKDIKKVQNKALVTWGIAFATLLGGIGGSIYLGREFLVNQFDKVDPLNIDLALMGGLGLILYKGGANMIHYFACPSSVKKYLKYQEKGDERMRNILNWAGFSPMQEFNRVKFDFK